MRLIHLSDFHLNTKDQNSTKVLNALKADLTSQNNQKPIDAVIISGDLFHKGNTDLSEQTALLNELESLKKSIPNNIDFIFCPGNHDNNLPKRKSFYEPIFESITDSKKANELLTEPYTNRNSEIFSHIHDYVNTITNFDKTAYNTNPLSYFKIIKSELFSVGILSVNSSWTTRGGGQKDYGNLYIGEKQINEALPQLGLCEIKILVCHHPFEWLAPEEQATIRQTIAGNFDAVLCGHLHDNNASTIISNQSSFFLSNTGCVYQSKEYFNGYSIIDIDYIRRCWTVHAREYYFQRNVFDLAPRFWHNGKKEYQFVDKNGQFQVTIPLEAIHAARDKANSKLLSFSASDIAPKQVGSIFVPPPLSKISEKKLTTKESNPEDEILTLSQIAEDSRNILILGKRESGKTVLINYIATNRFWDFHKGARLGLVIDMAVLKKPNRSELLQNAVDYLNSEISRRELVKLLEQGSVVVLIDNIKHQDIESLKTINEFISEFNLCRFVFVCNEEPFDDIQTDTYPDFGTNTIKCHILSFRNQQTRELVKKWFDNQPQHQEELCHSINKLLQKLNIPKTPFLISILLWIAEKNQTSSLINKASAIDTLISGLLNRFASSNSRSEIDHVIQDHFLSDFSRKLDIEAKEWISIDKFNEFVFQYFQQKGLNTNFFNFSDDLLAKGILYRSSDKIGFKFDCFRAYFLAKKIASDQSLSQYAISTENINRYSFELDILTGLYRDRLDILNGIRSTCKALMQQSGLSIDLNLVGELGNTYSLLSSNSFKNFHSSVIEKAESRDDIIDFVQNNEPPSEVSINHDVGRQRKFASGSSVEIKLLMAIQAYSNTLRNSELIDNIELKQDCLNEVLEYWASILILCILDARKIDFLEELKKSKDYKEEEISEENFRAFIELLFQQAIFAYASESIATPKLKKFFVHSRDNEKYLITSLFSALLCLDIAEETALSRALEILKENKKNNLIVQSIYFKLIFLYIDTSTPQNYEKIRKTLGDIYTETSDGNSLTKNKNQVMFLQRLDKQRLTGN